MRTQQSKWTEQNGWQWSSSADFPTAPQIVLVFGSRLLLSEAKYFNEIKEHYPESHVLMCSTAGEIINTEVSDQSIVVTAILFEKTELSFEQSRVTENSSEASFEIGKELANKLDKEGLVHAMVFSDGLEVIGTSLVRGLIETLPKSVSVTGGLAGDSDNFKQTLVGLDVPPETGNVVVVGFYGEHLKIGYGSLGGWDSFGPERLITKSKGNLLYEVDNQSALQLYKQYLGELASGLPATALLFPVSLRLQTEDGKEVEVVRSVLGVNEEDQSLIFAGEMPEGVYGRLMKANLDRLIDGAADAANISVEHLANEPPDLAILISCVGRKLVLKERVEEETEAVRTILGDQPAITGFYSYGEICPTIASGKQCQFHNQTMTITTFREI